MVIYYGGSIIIFDSDLKGWKPKKNSPGLRLVPFFWKITSRVTTKKLKNGQRGNFELGPLFSFFLTRKTLSSGQKWFLRPYFPLFRGMFLLRSGLRFLYVKVAFSSLSILIRNIPLISGKYGLRNAFWPLERIFLMRKGKKKRPIFLGTLLPILRLTFLESSCNFRKFGFKKNDGHFFFSIWRVFRTHVGGQPDHKKIICSGLPCKSSSYP